jgi:hypothetical protein
MRHTVEMHVNPHTAKNCPIPTFKEDSIIVQRIVFLVTSILSEDQRFHKWISDIVLLKNISFKLEQKNNMIFELDALVAHAFGLSKSELTHIYETFHKGWDYSAQLAITLKYFDEWEKEANA